MHDGARVGDITIWDLDTGSERSRLNAWGDVPINTCGGWWAVNAMAMSPDDSILATAVNHEVQLWDLPSEMLTSRFKLGVNSVSDFVTSLGFSADGKALAVGNVGMKIILRDMATGAQRELRIPRDSVNSISFSPDGRVLAVSTSYWHTVWILDVASGQVIGELQGHTNSVNCVTFGRDGALIVTGGADGHVKAWRDYRLQMTWPNG
jgi:WD40 repeat protein